jgi:arylsulfatase
VQFIVCVIECLRKDHVGCYGYPRPTTPCIDELARRSITYRNSRSVLGDTPSTFWVLATGSGDVPVVRQPADYPMLPRVLADHGIDSHLITANHIPFAGCLPPWDYTHVSTHMKQEVSRWAEDLGSAHVLVEEAKSLSGDFYLVIHFKETHGPYTARRFYGEFLPPDSPGPTLDIADEPGLPGTIFRDYTIGGERSAGFYTSQYDGAIRYVDGQIGRLIQHFPEAHVIVTGDHGEAMGEADRYFCHGYGMFHELLEVPLIYHTPEGTANVELESVTHLNIPATVLDAFGIVPPAEYLTPCLPVRERELHQVARMDDPTRERFRALGGP